MKVSEKFFICLLSIILPLGIMPFIKKSDTLSQLKFTAHEIAKPDNSPRLGARSGSIPQIKILPKKKIPETQVDIPPKPGLYGTNDGSGPGVEGVSRLGCGVHGWNSTSRNTGSLGCSKSGVSGTTNNASSHAGLFENTNAQNNYSTLFAKTNGPGWAIHAESNHSTGHAGYFKGNVAATSESIDTITGSFENTNAQNNYSTLFAKTNGPGWAIHAESNHSTGHAGYFKGNVQVDGRTTTKVLEITGGSDLSEQFEITLTTEEIKPGLLVCIDPKHPGKLVLSQRAYDQTVAGVISGAGGISTGMLMGQKNSGVSRACPVALSGRVYVWADASYGAIEPGDMLTTSPLRGHAMKATNHEQSFGAVIGKAMQPLKEGRGLILVLINLQ